MAQPEVYARPPQDGQALVDLRALPGHRIEIGRGEHAHYTLENSEGVQIAEFHNSPDQAVTILEPGQTLPLYLRRLDDDAEYAVPPGLERFRIAGREPSRGLIATRGAAAHAFGKIFSLPFGPGWVHPLPEDQSEVPQVRRPGDAWRPVLGWSLVGVGLAAGLTGAGVEVSAELTREGLSSQQQAQEFNRSLQNRNWQAGISFGLGGLAAATGAIILLSSPADPKFGISAGPSQLQLWGRF
jgi:hypothetical protein